MSSDTVVDRASTFDCRGERLMALSSVPARCFKRAVLVVVGGPQYRAGSHRQFTLLCRALAAHGIAAMRFDYRGMGDSEGSARDFEGVGDDLRAAVAHLFSEHPAVEEVVLWGLCDAASAVLFYAQHDPRVGGLVLLNPWVRTTEGLARAYVKGYYAQRILDASLWKKVLGGQFNLMESGRGFVSNLARAAGLRGGRRGVEPAQGILTPLPERMLAGWRAFGGRILLVLSGNDLTADEFRTLTESDARWGAALAEPRVQRCDVPGANHTFARAEWRQCVEQVTAQWVRSW